MYAILSTVFTWFLRLVGVLGTPYSPTWESLDSRPLPAWYDDAKFGIFIHWGVFSVPAYGGRPKSESCFLVNEWYEKNNETLTWLSKNYRPGITYADFAKDFTAEFYNPKEWAQLFQDAGAKYIVLVTKHHEGYTNWPSAVSWNWNSMDVGPKRDLTGDLATAIRNYTDIRFGIYHSQFEFVNPLYLEDQKNGFKTNNFVKRKTGPELYDIVNRYMPEVIWSDGDWDAPYQYWNSTNFLAWLYNDSPVKDSVVVNDRWGAGMSCKHGGYYTCHDKYNPKVLQPHKWENCLTTDLYSWGYRRDITAEDIIDIHQLITILAETVSCGGNMLLNVGPTHDGRIIPVFQERLIQMGQWLKVNGEAIYATKPWKYQNDTLTSDIWYTQSKVTTSVYAIVLQWPGAGKLKLSRPTVGPGTTITMLGYAGQLQFAPRSTGGVTIQFPAVSIADIPSLYAWVLKMDNLANS